MSSSTNGGSSTSQAKLNEIGVGKKYQSIYGNGKGSDTDTSTTTTTTTTTTPWLSSDNNVELHCRIRDNCWKRSWDGVEGTAYEHAQWVLQQARSLTSDERAHEFRPFGSNNNNNNNNANTKNGYQYYIHDTMTQEAGGYGFFKIEGTLDLLPRDLLAFVFDMEAVASVDSTVVINKVIATYRGTNVGDPFQAVAYWCNDPGFPFTYRDGIDLTAYHRDKDMDDQEQDGTCWQLSTSLHGGGKRLQTSDDNDDKDKDKEVEEVSCFQSQGIHATDRLFVYKLVPKTDADGRQTTHVTLLSQTILNGYIPKFVSNRMICSILMNYMKTIELQVKKRKESGEHDVMLQQLELTHV